MGDGGEGPDGSSGREPGSGGHGAGEGGSDGAAPDGPAADGPASPGEEELASALSGPPAGAGGSGDGGGAGTGTAAGPPEDDEGLSTAAKVGLGCGGCLLVLAVAAAAVVALGGGWIVERAGELAGTAERQVEATETLDRLRSEHDFRPPADGAVEPERARRFFAVTDAAWREMRDWSDQLRDLERELEDRDVRLSDMGTVMEGYSRLAESRVVLARALEEQDMPLAEYLWTGLTLRRAHRAVEEGAAADTLPASTREAVREHRAELEELTGDEEPGRQLVLLFAMTWGSAEEGLRGVPGLDTLLREP